MALGTWWHNDPLPKLAPLPHFSARPSTDTRLIAHLTGLLQQEIEYRFQSGNHIYITYMGESPAAYGWVAMQEGRVHEIELFFKLPPGDSYLWDFKTLPEWRGRGIYSHLLQEIVIKESYRSQHFWIIYKSDNDISGRGIRKAGFRIVGDLTIIEGRAAGLELFEASDHARTASTVLNLPIIKQK
jgi:ribosomal protein S18 acetylase RimI-like enzyme